MTLRQGDQASCRGPQHVTHTFTPCIHGRIMVVHMVRTRARQMQVPICHPCRPQSAYAARIGVSTPVPPHGPLGHEARPGHPNTCRIHGREYGKANGVGGDDGYHAIALHRACECGARGVGRCGAQAHNTLRAHSCLVCTGAPWSHTSYKQERGKCECLYAIRVGLKKSEWRAGRGCGGCTACCIS